MRLNAILDAQFVEQRQTKIVVLKIHKKCNVLTINLKEISHAYLNHVWG